MFRAARRLKKSGLPAGLISLSICFAASGATSSVSLSWSASSDSGIAGYNIYYGGRSGTYTNVISVGNSTNAIIPALTDGNTYYFAATAYDAYGDESGFSNEISYIVPGILTITPAAIPGTAAHIQFPAAPGQQYQLQASEDLQIWSTIWQTTANSNIWIQFDDPQTRLPQRFYRLISN